MGEVPFDDSLTLDIPDVLPDHLAGGEEAHLTQNSIDVFSLPDGGSVSSVRPHSGRKRDAFTLPDRISMASDSIADGMDDMSDLLLPGSPCHPHFPHPP